MLRTCLYRLTWAGVPFFGLYALYLRDEGVSDGRFSLLLIIAALTGFLAEVPSGVLADRLDRRLVLHLSSLSFAALFGCWLLVGGFAGFAVGFFFWGVAGALWSGTLQALLFDSLKARGLEHDYAKLQAYSSTAMAVAAGVGLLSASPLFHLGGYPLVAWVSAGVVAVHMGCVFTLPHSRATDGQASALAVGETAAGLTSTPVASLTHAQMSDQQAAANDLDLDQQESGGENYWRTLRTGLTQVWTTKILLRLVVAFSVMALASGVEEFLPRVWDDIALSTSTVPLALGAMAAMAGLGNALAARASTFDARSNTTLAACCTVLLGVGALVGGIVGVAMMVTGFGMCICVMTSMDIRLQYVISSTTRATVSSIFGLAAEVGGITCLALIGVLTAHWSLALTIVAIMAVCTVALIPLMWRAVTTVEASQAAATPLPINQ